MTIDKKLIRPLSIVAATVFVIYVFLALGSGIFLFEMRLPLESYESFIGIKYLHAYSDNPMVVDKVRDAHVLSAIVVIGMVVTVLLKSRQKKLHGDAKWAKESDLRDADPCLRGSKGILIGEFKGKYVIQSGQQFVFLAAPTRSKKGVGVVIPNCLNWHDSLVVTDIKLENYRITSGYRKAMGQDVFLFNPSPKDYKTHRWNPLGYISEDLNFRIDDIQKIAAFLVPTPKGTDPMWSSGARDLFLGVVLFLLDDGRYPVTLGEVFRQLSTERGSAEYFTDILEDKSEYLDAVCVMALSKFCNLPSKQREGVKSTLETALNLWANPLLDAATSENDFDLRDIRKRRMSIYVGITPDNLIRLAPILNLFFQQLVDLNTQKLPEKSTEPFTALLLLDEFPALGKMDTISKGVSYIAGYNLRLLPIVQTPAQLTEIYGREGASNFIENHASRIVYAPKAMEQAKEIAEELGTITTTSESVSKPRDMGKGLGSKTKSETKRQLLLPQEVKEIGKDNEIIISENCKPIMAQKIIYYEDDNFLKRCIPKENLDAVKECRDQETFLTLVRPAAYVPTIEVTPHAVRGRNEEVFDLNFDSVVLPETEGTLSDEEIDVAADEFMAMISGK